MSSALSEGLAERLVDLQVLTIRGRVVVTEVDGVPADYAASVHRYLGDEGAGRYLGDIDQSGATMAASTFA